jgi:hypothetical protein
MRELYAQGDVLLELVPDLPASRGVPIARDSDGAVVLARGEVTGHRHVLWGQATFFRDDSLARDIPNQLYVGHLRVEEPTALVHEEHAPIALARGTYRVSLQRELEPTEARLVLD